MTPRPPAAALVHSAPMGFEDLRLAGADHLALVTELLRRERLEDPTGGLLEAADLQWWWRTPRPSDQLPQRYWLDGGGRPVAAVVVTDWPRVRAVDLIALPSVRDQLLPELWEHALAVGGPFEVAVSTDDPALERMALDSGLGQTGHGGFVSSLEADRVPPPSGLPPGFRLSDREDDGARPHHMIARSGPDVAGRLAETSLYRPDLDLFVTAPDGSVAAYGLFWLDPVTGVGLVEPMRTEDPHQGRGLGRHVLTAGLNRLVARGARLLKIGHLADNPVSAGLYASVGFVPYCEYRLFAGGGPGDGP